MEDSCCPQVSTVQYTYILFLNQELDDFDLGRSVDCERIYTADKEDDDEKRHLSLSLYFGFTFTCLSHLSQYLKRLKFDQKKKEEGKKPIEMNLVVREKPAHTHTHLLEIYATWQPPCCS